MKEADQRRERLEDGNGGGGGGGGEKIGHWIQIK